MIDTRTLEQPVTNSEGGLVNPMLAYYQSKQQADADKARMFLDRINAINLPSQSTMQNSIPSRYTQQQGGQQISGLQPMQMYQNRNQYHNQYGTPADMAPMQMLNQYRQTGASGVPGATSPAGGK